MTNDLTKGPVAPAVLAFTLPMVAGNLFQQLYNVADTVIVGRYLGADALAAVGSAFTTMVFLTSVLFGLCMGASVLFSQLFGAGELSQLREAVYNALLLIGSLAVGLNVLALLGLDWLLGFLNTPPSIYALTREYLQMIFFGLLFSLSYNFFSCLLRSVGNSLVPLLFLIACAVLNIVLDLWFILGLHWGVSGAALATVLSQGLSGVLTALYCVHRLKLPRPEGGVRIRRTLLGKLARLGVLTSIQQSVMNFGILLIQGLVNSFGVSVMAAFAAAVKIDAFAYMPVQDFGNAFSTYIAQNTGAKLPERVRQGTKVCFLLCTGFSLFISVFVVLFAPALMGIFIAPTETEILAHGVAYLRIVGVFYVLIGYLFLFYGLFRGRGQPGVSIVLTILSLGSRVGLSYLLAPVFGVSAIWWSIPAGWLLADAVGVLLLWRSLKSPALTE